MIEYALGYITGALVALLPGFHINNLAIFIYKISLLHHSFNFFEFLLAAVIASSLFSYLAVLIWRVADNEETYASSIASMFASRNLHHKYLEISLFASSVVLLLVAITLPLMLKFYKKVYSISLLIAPYILAFLLIRMLIKESKLLVLSSSIFGYYAFKTSININALLTASFFGMFALPYFLSAKPHISFPIKENIKNEKEIKGLINASILGYVSSLITSFIPAISPLVLGSLALSKIKPPKHIVAFLAALSFSDMLLSLITLPITHNSRNGFGIFLYALKPIRVKDLFIIVMISAIAIAITHKIIKLFLRKKAIINSQVLKYIALITVLGYLFSSAGFKILLVLIPSLLLGIYTRKNKNNQIALLSFLIFPTLLSMLFS